jgi:hypothetical protein
MAGSQWSGSEGLEELIYNSIIPWPEGLEELIYITILWREGLKELIYIA